MGLVLALCIFAMSLMSIALVWQAQVIAKQNAVIHMMMSRFGLAKWARFLFRNLTSAFLILSPDTR